MSKLTKKCTFKINQEEYIAGQTWCFMKKRHVFFYISILFSIGVFYEVTSIFLRKKISPAIIISAVAVVLYILLYFWIKHRFKQEYQNEPNNWEVVFENKGMMIQNDQMKDGLFFQYHTMKNVYKKKNLYIIFLNKYQVFFIPCRVENAHDIENWVSIIL